MSWSPTARAHSQKEGGAVLSLKGDESNKHPACRMGGGGVVVWASV